MRSFVNRFEKVSVSITTSRKLLNLFPNYQSVSFSTRLHSPKFNILFFCPRNEKHIDNFSTQYPDFIKCIKPKSVSVTDTAHNPNNNYLAIKALLGRDIKPSMIIPHLVLMSHSKDGTDEKIKFFKEMGVRSIFLVRGNPMVLGKGREYLYHPDGYKNMEELIQRTKYLVPDMEVIVAGYPDKHPFAKVHAEDFDSLKSKIDSGADRIITQHFFRNETLLEFVDQCQKRRICKPIVPSIMPLGNPKYLVNFSEGAGVPIPEEVRKILLQGKVTRNNSFIRDRHSNKLAIEYTANQIIRINKMNLNQVDRINVYSANNLDFLKAVLGDVRKRGNWVDFIEEESLGDNYSRQK